MWGLHDGMGWWMVFGGLWMVAFWGIVIGLVVWGVNRTTGGSGRRPDANETSIEIAEKRLARGEITREQFEQLKEALQ